MMILGFLWVYNVPFLSGEGIGYYKEDFQVYHGITDAQHIICTGQQSRCRYGTLLCLLYRVCWQYEVFIVSCGLDFILSHTLLCSEWSLKCLPILTSNWVSLSRLTWVCQYLVGVLMNTLTANESCHTTSKAFWVSRNVMNTG